MPWWGWVLLAPVAALAAFTAFFAVVGATSIPSVGWHVGFNGVVRPVRIHYRHWLPRLLQVWGIAMYPHVYLKGELWPKGKPWDGKTPTAQAWQVGHELWHCWQAIEWGWLRYRATALWQIVRYWRHNSRPMEQEANARQAAITLGTDPIVEAPRLAAFDNAGMP